MSKIQKEFNLKLSGETRVVTVTQVWEAEDTAFDTGRIVVAKTRAGTKYHPCKVRFYKQPDGTYKPNLRTEIMNRPATICNWLDKVSSSQINSNGITAA